MSSGQGAMRKTISLVNRANKFAPKFCARRFFNTLKTKVEIRKAEYRNTDRMTEVGRRTPEQNRHGNQLQDGIHQRAAAAEEGVLAALGLQALPRFLQERFNQCY